jgi:SRSO17 transposase
MAAARAASELHHYEGRNWRGFHHHASLCIAAYGFLMCERLRSKKTPLDSKRLLCMANSNSIGSGASSAGLRTLG